METNLTTFPDDVCPHPEYRKWKRDFEASLRKAAWDTTLTNGHSVTVVDLKEILGYSSRFKGDFR